MKQRPSAIVKWSFLAAYVCFTFIYLKKTLQPELHYHVQQPAFQLNREFFARYMPYTTDTTL